MAPTEDRVLFDNPVRRAIRDIDAKLATVDADARDRLERASSLELSDWLDLGDLASRALMDGDIDAETATVLHAIHSDFNGRATLAERIVFVQVSHELVGRRVARLG